MFRKMRRFNQQISDSECIEILKNTTLVLQKEEVDEVKWFDIDEVREGCIHRDGTFCVPMEGLETLMKYLGEDQ
ncbi:MAG: hypothetical protein E7302_17690 [Butyrivibrio sp.]|nr:hypothetical protein [Butyrivibrio sp.]